MNDYYTVSEYASLYNKDPGNIRRLLISGRIPGEKIGKQWIIKKGTPFPRDERVKSGQFKRIRRYYELLSSNRSLKQALPRVITNAKSIYGDQIDSVILYGSYARGNQTDESDVDIALILTGKYTDEQHDLLIDALVDIELDTGLVLSVICVNHDDFISNRDSSLFYRNIQKEGITLWKTA